MRFGSLLPVDRLHKNFYTPRSRSSRATITSTSFINEYHWGNLKGDPLDWMQRYFDAHVYSANWGNCSLMLRFPLSALDQGMLGCLYLHDRSDCFRPE